MGFTYGTLDDLDNEIVAEVIVHHSSSQFRDWHLASKVVRPESLSVDTRYRLNLENGKSGEIRLTAFGEINGVLSFQFSVDADADLLDEPMCQARTLFRR